MGSTGRTDDLISLAEITAMHPEGIFLQMKSEIFYVLAYETNYIGKKRVHSMVVRELISGEISALLILRILDTPALRYITSSPRPGSEKNPYSERYQQEVTDPRLHLLDLRPRICIYKGDHVCVDLGNGNLYSLAHCSEQVKHELSGVKVGDIVSVCVIQDRIFFLASYIYGSAKIKAYQTSERVILKREKRFKKITAETGSSYVVRSIRGYNTSKEKLYRPPISFRHLSADICEELNLSYGHAIRFEGVDEEDVYFINLADSNLYKVPIESVSYEMLYSLRKRSCIASAHITDTSSHRAYLMRIFESRELGALEFVYTTESHACYIDMDTYEMHEIPFRYLPKGVKENELLTGYYTKDYELRAIDLNGEVYLLWRLKKTE